MKKTFKYITFFLAITWIISMAGYSSVMIGILAHELTHSLAAVNPSTISLDNYDMNGKIKATKFYSHDHRWAYFNGWIVMVALLTISLISIIIIFGSSESLDSSGDSSPDGDHRHHPELLR